MKTPDWIPANHIYFDLETFPLEQLVSAIKGRVVELGGRPEPMTAERRGRLYAENRRYETERKKFRTTDQGYQRFIAELPVLFQEIETKVKALAASGITIEVGYNNGRCVIRDEIVSMAAYSRFSGYGKVEYEMLTVEEYAAKTELPTERWGWLNGRPTPTTQQFELEMTPGRALVWKPKTGDDLHSTKVMADRLVIRFLELSESVTKERNRKPGKRWI